MITIRQDALLLNLLSVSEARYIPRSDDRRTWSMPDRSLALEMIERAKIANDAPLAVLRATEYASERYIKTYTERVETLKALVLGTCCQGSDSFCRAMTDVVYEICSQPDWSLCSSQDGVCDYTNTTIDVYCCETGALLAMTGALCGNFLSGVSPKVNNLISHTLKTRLLDPLINWEGVSWKIEGPGEARAVAALITASLLGETDDRRRWLCLRRALSLLETCIKKLPEDGGFVSGLENHLQTCLALDDCFSLLSLATGGAVEMRDEAQFVSMAQAIADAHVDGRWFVNPGGDPAPKIDTDALFRLGEEARLTSLCELAAYLRRVNGSDAELPHSLEIPTPPLYQRVMSAFCRADLSRQTARVEKRAKVVKRDMKLLLSRMDGFFVALEGCAGPGKNAPAVGDLALFLDDGPEILTYPAPQSRLSSVPTIGGVDQISVPAKDLDCQDGAGYSMLSMNIASAYPKKAGVVSWQRTLMLLSFESSIRLMDVFDLEEAQSVTFRFVFASQPHVKAGLVETDRIMMQFDPELSVRVETLKPDGEHFVYRLELYAPVPVSTGNFSFVFRRRAGSR